MDGFSNKVCVPNETEDLKLHTFNMTTGINESRTLTKHISCKCDCTFGGRKRISNHNRLFECKKGCFGNLATCSCKNGKYAGSIIDDSIVICSKIVEETKTILTKTVLTKCTVTILFINWHCIIDNC